MKGAILVNPGEPLEIADLTLGNLRAREVQVRVEKASVCHTDLTIQQGGFPQPVPAVIGHEAAGVVEAVGEGVRRLKPGDPVVGIANPFCGQCPHCYRGETFLCSAEATFRAPEDEQRVNRNGEGVFAMAGLGAFSERMLAHENSLVAIPGGLSFTRATMLGCGVSTGLGAALNTAGVGAGGHSRGDRLRNGRPDGDSGRPRCRGLAHLCRGPSRVQAAHRAVGRRDRRH